MSSLRYQYHSDQKRAFTLIELLVVIAIIALLAAILFPVFSRARENARRSACASNEKQMSLGIIQYIQDNDEHPPAGISPDSTHSSCVAAGYGWGWGGNIYPYVKTDEVFSCPDDKYAGKEYQIGSTGVYGQLTSYAYNQNLLIGKNACTKVNGPISELNQPSVTVLLMEVEEQRWTDPKDVQDNEANALAVDGRITPYCNGWNCDNDGNLATSNDDFVFETGPIGCTGANSVDWNNISTYPLDNPTGRHLDGANYAFWDGHVKWLKGSSVSAGNNASSPTAADSCVAGSNHQAAGTQGTMAGGPIEATFSIF